MQLISYNNIVYTKLNVKMEIYRAFINMKFYLINVFIYLINKTNLSILQLQEKEKKNKRSSKKI